MTRVTAQEAHDQFWELIEAVEHGEEVAISRDGVVRMRIVPERDEKQPKERRIGRYDGQAIENDPNWADPMSDEEIRELFGDDFL